MIVEVYFMVISLNYFNFAYENFCPFGMEEGYKYCDILRHQYGEEAIQQRESEL